MASCEVQAVGVEEATDKIETPAVSTNDAEIVNNKNGAVLQPTKIPGPVRLDSNGSYIYTSNRKYTSLMKSMETRTPQDDSFSSTSTLVNTAEDIDANLVLSMDTNIQQDESLSQDPNKANEGEDSGIQMDCLSIEEDNLSNDLELYLGNCSSPQPDCSIDTITICDSLIEFEEAEQQTLRVLQQAVAEMEADVALHGQLLEEQLQLELQNNFQFQHDLEQEQKREIEPEMEIDLKQQQQQQQESGIDVIEQQEDAANQEEQLDSMDESGNSSNRSSARERKHIRVEQLLEAEHDIEMLQKLLHADNEQATLNAALLPAHPEEASLFEMNAVDDMIDTDNIIDMEAERSKNHDGLFYSMLTMICGKNIRKLSYPILFCGMAVGLIYYFRKA